jgi:DNA-binding NarL/FixJ family response regulator
VDSIHVVAPSIPATRKLANREVAVLQLVATGRTNKEIATELGISHSTVCNHMSAVFFKLGVGNRTQAVLYAVRSGLFSV